MTDTARINAIIDNSGYKREKVAEVLGMSTSSLYNKTHGVQDFTLPEANAFCDFFGITDPHDKTDIFFNPRVATIGDESEVKK